MIIIFNLIVQTLYFPMAFLPEGYRPQHQRPQHQRLHRPVDRLWDHKARLQKMFSKKRQRQRLPWESESRLQPQIRKRKKHVVFWNLQIRQAPVFPALLRVRRQNQNQKKRELQNQNQKKRKLPTKL